METFRGVLIEVWHALGVAGGPRVLNSDVWNNCGTGEFIYRVFHSTATMPSQLDMNQHAHLEGTHYVFKETERCAIGFRANTSRKGSSDLIPDPVLSPLHLGTVPPAVRVGDR